MAVREIRLKDDGVLRKKSRPVEKISQAIQVLLDDMAETMYDANGVGLAAPQVGILRRVVTIDVGDDNGLLEMINPRIIETEGEQINQEGCLSAPGESGYVERPEKVVCEYTNRKGELVKIEAEGLLAIAICHETDHLEGILYLDKVIPEDELEDIEDDFDDEQDLDEQLEQEEILEEKQEN